MSGMRIGEVAQASGTTAKTLRYYEDVGLLPDPDRSPAGYRDYGPEVLDRLHFIRRGQAAGLTLAQIGQVLAIRDRGQAPCQHVTDLLDTRRARAATHHDRHPARARHHRRPGHMLPRGRLPLPVTREGHRPVAPSRHGR